MFKPYVGMKFGSLAEAYDFYNIYSWVLGFSIRNGDNFVNVKDIQTMQEYKFQRSGINKNTIRSTTRCGCKAELRVYLNDCGEWYVKSFKQEHN
uniref:FAR1 domain-containing protein n=1 Tax=Triticum urartu TaxID=4572 RepID=A0A8R7Q999_TRIUA